MRKLFFAALCFLIASQAAFSQKFSVDVKYVTEETAAGSNLIYYKPGQMLSWDDFKGRPVAASEAAALSNAGFGLKLAFHKSGNVAQLMISVNCNFSKKDSWVKSGNKNSYILNHEQKHFDIAYYHTLMFIKKLQQATLTNANYASVIEKIYNECAQAMGRMQNEYDAETSHSRIEEKQSEWNLKIARLLDAGAAVATSFSYSH